MTLTEDAFLGGRVVIAQPLDGYRAAMDPVLLAAACPDLSQGHVLELGCGVGTALLCYGARVPGPALYGLEIDPETAATARENAQRNGMSDRVTIHTGDILQPPSQLLEAAPFDLVLANPPYLKPDAADAPPDPHKRRSMVEGEATLKDWVSAILRFTRPKGSLVMIHRADRVDEIVAHLRRQAGEIAILPLWPRAGSPAKRVIVRARKGVRGGSILHPGLTLHGEDRYTAEAAAILRDGAALS